METKEEDFNREKKNKKGGGKKGKLETWTAEQSFHSNNKTGDYA